MVIVAMCVRSITCHCTVHLRCIIILNHGHYMVTMYVRLITRPCTFNYHYQKILCPNDGAFRRCICIQSMQSLISLKGTGI